MTHIEWLDKVESCSYPRNTKPGAYIPFTSKIYIVESWDFIAGDHVSITFLMTCGDWQWKQYTKLIGCDMEKIDLHRPKWSLFDIEEDDTSFDTDENGILLPPKKKSVVDDLLSEMKE